MHILFFHLCSKIGGIGTEILLKSLAEFWGAGENSEKLMLRNAISSTFLCESVAGLKPSHHPLFLHNWVKCS